MKKFVVLFSVPSATMQDWMANTDETTRDEQMKEILGAWETWKNAHLSAIVDDGMGLGKTKHVSKDGVTDTKNDLNYMMIIQAESHEEAAEILMGNPHLEMIPGSYAEVMDTSGPANS